MVSTTGHGRGKECCTSFVVNVISAMNTWGDRRLENAYFSNCLIVTYMEILCCNTSVKKDTCML